MINVIQILIKTLTNVLVPILIMALSASFLCANANNEKTTTLTMQLPPNSIELTHGSGEPTHAVIWLHGLGATANDFPPVVPELGLNKTPTIRFIFPQAPNRPITINGGMEMPGWYDIRGVKIEDKQDAVGMAESQAMVEGLISQLVESGIASQNIILAGFSQGGAVTYYTGVRSKHELGGMLALSTYLPFDTQTEQEQSGVNTLTPILACHGTHDAVVPLALGEMSAKTLTELGYSVRWETYPMEHNVIMPQIKTIGQWINTVFEQP